MMNNYSNVAQTIIFIPFVKTLEYLLLNNEWRVECTRKASKNANCGLPRRTSHPKHALPTDFKKVASGGETRAFITI